MPNDTQLVLDKSAEEQPPVSERKRPRKRRVTNAELSAYYRESSVQASSGERHHS